MKRMRLCLALLVILSMVQFLTACAARDWVGDSVEQDAKRGAAVGFTIGGPEGAAIGSVAVAILGFIIRAGEKRSLRKRGILTDQHAITRRTAKPADPAKSMAPDKPEPSGEYPQQHIGL